MAHRSHSKVSRGVHHPWHRYVLGLDTIDRRKLIDILQTFLNTDDLKLIRLLLSDTHLNISIGHETTTLKTIIGTPQGDSLSPILFIVYLEGALRELRPNLIPTHITPREMIYADDVDMIFDKKEDAEKNLEIIARTLQTWNLKVNENKTEYTHIKKDEDEWKKTRKLGTLLGEWEEISRRKNLAIAAHKNMQSIFIRRHKLSEDKRIKLYNALVLPILTYNCGTWALTETQTESIDSFHRRQLRSILGIHYPDIISNKDLYQRCKTGPIRFFITKQRWQLFGHVLRRDEDIPAHQAMTHYFKNTNARKHRGRPATSLPTVLKNDVNDISDLFPREAIANDHTYSRTLNSTSCRKLETKDDFVGIRNIAADRELWHRLGCGLLERMEAVYVKPHDYDYYYLFCLFMKHEIHQIEV